MSGPTWKDLYGETPPQIVPLDTAGDALIKLLPEDKRAEMEPMLRGMLANMRLQLGEKDYIKFCGDMETAYEYHVAGDAEKATMLFGAYGIPYNDLQTMGAS